MKKIITLFEIEISKHKHQRFPVFSLIFTIIFTLAAALLRNSLSGGESLSMGKANGWQILTFASAWGIQLATLMMLILSINLFAEEYSERTIKNILSKPVSRTQFLLAKILTLIFLVFIFVSMIMLASFICGAILGSFGNLQERGYVLIKWQTIFTNLAIAYLLTIFTMSVVAVFGTFISVFMPKPGIAIGVSVCVYFALNVAAQFDAVKNFIFAHYTSFPIDTAKDISYGLAASWTPKIYWCFLTDLGWLVVLIYLANFILKRKDILV